MDFCCFFHCIITYLLPTYYQLITYLLLTYYSLGSLFGRFLIDFCEGWSVGFCAESFVDFCVKSEPNRTEQSRTEPNRTEQNRTEPNLNRWRLKKGQRQKDTQTENKTCCKECLPLVLSCLEALEIYLMLPIYSNFSALPVPY